MDEFDRRIRNQRGLDSDDSDEAPRQVRILPPPAGKKIEELQRQMAQAKKPKDEVEETIASKNESLKDKKIRELASRCKSL